MSPCRSCKGNCCRYFALQLDTPRSRDDFEKIRWYLAHQNICVFVEGKKWFLDIHNKCKYLGKNNRCSIYEKRPTICREHSIDECERNGEFEHEHSFSSLEEFDEFFEKNIAKRWMKNRG